MDGMNNGMPNNQAPQKNTVGTVLGILAIVVGVIGGLCFGIFGAIAGLACGIVGLVLSINVKKASNDQVGGAGFICGIVGIALSAFFLIGCAAYGSCSAGYMCYGCIGGSCKVANDAASGAEDVYELLEDMDY